MLPAVLGRAVPLLHVSMHDVGRGSCWARVSDPPNASTCWARVSDPAQCDHMLGAGLRPRPMRARSGPRWKNSPAGRSAGKSPPGRMDRNCTRALWFGWRR
jgi:hypothetical protein